MAGDADSTPDRSLRILVIGLNYTPEPTGIAPYTAGLARGMADRGHRVTVITGYPHYPSWSVQDGYTGASMRERIDGVDVLRLRHPVPSRPSLLPRTLMEVTFGVRAALASWERPDVVVAISPALFATDLINLRARLAGIPVVTWIQDIYTVGVSDTGAAASMAPVVRAAERLAVRSSNRVVAIHDRFKRVITGQLGADGDQVDVIRNWSHIGESPDGPDPSVRAMHGWSDDEVIVLHAGNMGAKQGLDNVVRASAVAAERDSKVRFVLLGDGNQRGRLEELHRELNRTTDGGTHLQFLDPLPDGLFEKTMASADLLLVNERPGLTDMSVPSKLTSYFTTGRPVIGAVDEGSITAEELAAAQCGPRVDPTDPGALVDAAESLMADESAAEQAGQNGRAYCEERLSADAAMTAFEQTLYAAADQDHFGQDQLDHDQLDPERAATIN